MMKKHLLYSIFILFICCGVVLSFPAEVYAYTESKAIVSEGTYILGVYAGGAANHTNLNIDDSDTTTLSMVANGSHTYHMANLIVSTPAINSITLYAKFRKTIAGTAKYRLLCRSGGADYYAAVAADITTTGSYTEYSYTWTTDPNTAAAWTLANANNAEFGFTFQEFTGGATAYCTYQYIVMDCTYPSVTTAVPKGVGSNWAILGGTVNYAATRFKIDYGLTTSYSTNSTTYGTYNAGTYYDTVLRNLSVGTVYHYRTGVYTGGYWYYGADNIFSTPASPTIFEAHQATTTSGNVTAANSWTFQTFYTERAHTVTSVKLLMLRSILDPGAVTVSIRNTSAGVPTGADLCSGTIASANIPTGTSQWVEATMSTSYNLQPLKTYAIVIRATTGIPATNYIRWSWQAPGTYSNGNAGFSSNSGATWTAVAANDYNFEIWGDTTLQVVNVKIFKSYIAADDWLITCRYTDRVKPNYPANDPPNYFVLQLLNGPTTILSQTACMAWDDKPGAIYLSSATATPLEWGNTNYRVAVTANYSSNITGQYPLVSVDWSGDDLVELDNWCIAAATGIGTDANTSPPTMLTIDVAGKGTVLNEQGGVMFSVGIPRLSSIRPGIFQTATVPTTTTAQGYVQYAPPWQTIVGPDVTAALTDFGNAVGMSGRMVGGIIMFALFMVVGLCITAGNGAAAIIFSVPMIMAGTIIGFYDAAFYAVLAMLCALLLVWQFWWKGA